MKPRVAWVTLALAALVAGGCTTTAMLSTPQPGTSVAVKQTTATTLPRSEVISATTFGNYEFRAERPGVEPLYGRLPLRFSGGDLALDILFFAPAIFLNVRQAFPFYEFDLDQRVVRFKGAEKDAWQTYTPNDVDVAKAKFVFGPH
jgi:hypothetical protein